MVCRIHRPIVYNYFSSAQGCQMQNSHNRCSLRNLFFRDVIKSAAKLEESTFLAVTSSAFSNFSESVG